MTFVPKKKEFFKNKIKNYLIEGNIIRLDSIGENPLEIIDRKYIDILPISGNIGNFKGTIKPIDNIFCSHNILYEIIDELNKEYSIREVRCTHSGCCQYTTYGYFID